MKVKKLIDKLKVLPKDYVVEYHIGTDHVVIKEVKIDGPHQHGEWWQRRRKVVILS